MDVLTSETCWALNNVITKQVTSSCSLFIQRYLSVWTICYFRLVQTLVKLCLCVLPFSIYRTFFPCLAYSCSLKMETAYTSETSLHSHQTTHHQTPEGCHLHGHCCVNLKPHTRQKWSVEINEWNLLGMGEWQGFEAQYWEEEVINKRTVAINEVGSVGNVM